MLSVWELQESSSRLNGLPICMVILCGRGSVLCVGHASKAPAIYMGMTGTFTLSMRMPIPFLNGRMLPSNERLPSGKMQRVLLCLRI